MDDIAARAEGGAVILVEGLRDRDSMKSLGIEGNIVMTSQEPLFNLAERVSRQSMDVIVLTDWDERGEEVARNVDAYLKSNGSRPDLEPRKKLRFLTKKEVKDVESLHGYIVRLRRECSIKPQYY